MGKAKEVVDLRPGNGHAAIPAESAETEGPRIPRRVEWMPLPPEYPGFKVRMWRNYPQSIWKDVIADVPAAPDLSEIDDEAASTAATEAWQAEVRAASDRRLAALSAIFVEHNHWRDFDGSEYPPTTTRAFWDAIPQELAVILVTMADRSGYDLPNSLRLTRRR